MPRMRKKILTMRKLQILGALLFAAVAFSTVTQRRLLQAKAGWSTGTR